MTIWSFLTGLIIGFFPSLLLLKFFKGKVLFIENLYIKGSLAGVLLWIVINLFLYLETRHAVFGLLSGDEGFSTIVLLTSSLQGFITAGLLAALVMKKLGRNRQSPAGRRL